MEAFKEFMMLLENSIDERCGAIIKLPQRCVLNKSWDRFGIPGYFVTFDQHFVSTPATLFIADTPDGRLFHEAFSVFSNSNFNNRCLWVYEEDVTLLNTEEFYI